MKKLFLAVAFVAASISANAVVWPTLGTDTPCSHICFKNVTAAVIAPANGAAPVTATVTDNVSTKTGTVVGAVSTGTTQVKLSSGAKYHDYQGAVGNTDTLKADGRVELTSGSTLTTTVVVPATKTYTLTVYIGDNGTSDRGASVSVNGTVVGSVNFTAVVSKSEYGKVTYSLPAGTHTVLVTAILNTIQVLGIDVNTGTDSKDAIASSILSKVGNDLVNPTNLEVEVYTVLGAKVLTSSEASISVSGLASGVYVAKTAEGTLKFVK